MTHGPAPLTHTGRQGALPTVREEEGAVAVTQRREGRPVPAPGAGARCRQAEATAFFPFSLPFPPPFPGGRRHHVTDAGHVTQRATRPCPLRARTAAAAEGKRRRAGPEHDAIARLTGVAEIQLARETRRPRPMAPHVGAGLGPRRRRRRKSAAGGGGVRGRDDIAAPAGAEDAVPAAACAGRGR